MTQLNRRPARPRTRRSKPAYPRSVTAGALALAMACVGGAAGCEGSVDNSGEEASSSSGTGGYFQGTTGTPFGGGGTGGDEVGGNFAGGAPEPWGGGGVGGVGGDSGGAGGAGGACSTGGAGGGLAGGSAGDLPPDWED